MNGAPGQVSLALARAWLLLGQVVVIGVPDEQWGEAVKAVVVLKPGFEASDDLASSMQELVKQAKGSVQSPKSVDFVEGIPLTPVGKPDKWPSGRLSQQSPCRWAVQAIGNAIVPVSCETVWNQGHWRDALGYGT